MSSLAVVCVALSVVAIIGFVVVAYWRRWEWTGFVTSGSGGRKTLWDWMQLLGIPLVLAAVAFAFNEAQSSRDLRREDRRAALERRAASDQRAEEALRGYLQQMSDLMLQRGLLQSRFGSEPQSVARVLTLTVLRRLDGRRKGIVVQFLNEAGLIDGAHGDPKVRMDGADLRRAVVRGDLNHPRLNHTDLRGSDFRGAFINGGSFVLADLRGANFRGASVIFSQLAGADLRDADLRRASIRHTGFYAACMTHASLKGAHLAAPDLRRASGHDLDLTGATLEHMTFRRTWLADLHTADVRLVQARLPSAEDDAAPKDRDCRRQPG